MARPALAATRALDVISFLADHDDEAFTMAQIVRALRLNQGSAHAILTALVRDGFLRRDPTTKTFRLGPSLVAVGDAALRANPLIGAARATLRTFCEDAGVDAIATVRTGDELRVVARIERGATDVARASRRYPLMPPLGVVLMAWADDTEQRRWLDALPAADDSLREQLLALLDLVRAQGYHVATDARSRGELARRALELADDPLDDPRHGALVDAIRHLATTELARNGRARSAVAVTAPVLDPDGSAAMECTAYGVGRMSPSTVADFAGRLRAATVRIAASAWG